MKKTNLTLAFMFISVVLLIGGILLAAYADIQTAAKVLVIIITVILFLSFTVLACETERKSGVYVCKRCGAAFEIGIKQYTFSPHIGRSRRLRCPECGEKGYCKYKAKEDEYGKTEK